MGSHHAKHRHPRDNRPLSGASIYALCAGQPSKVVYSRSMEHCSLKLYRAESDIETDDQMVVLLDCGGKVYANGRKVYPFENGVTQGIKGIGDGERFQGTYKINGVTEKHVDSRDTTATLDTMLHLVSDTFDQMLKDGLRQQDSMRQLEEENTALSLKVLELQREQLNVQRLEMVRKKLELRIEELEAKNRLFANGNFTPYSVQRRTVVSLARTSSLGRTDYQHGCPGSARRTDSLRRFDKSGSPGGSPGSCSPNYTLNYTHNNKSPSLSPEQRRKECLKKASAVTHILELENKRKELQKETAELQFQFDTLVTDHEKFESGRLSPPVPMNNHISGSPPRSIASMFMERHAPLSPRLHRSMERLNSEFDLKQNGKVLDGDSKWERYDTLRKRYEELKQRRSQRLSRHGSTDDIVIHRDTNNGSVKRVDRLVPNYTGSGGSSRFCGSRDGSVSGDSDSGSSSKSSSGSEFEVKTNGVINGHHNTIVITKLDSY